MFNIQWLTCTRDNHFDVNMLDLLLDSSTHLLIVTREESSYQAKVLIRGCPSLMVNKFWVNWVFNPLFGGVFLLFLMFVFSIDRSKFHYKSHDGLFICLFNLWVQGAKCHFFMTGIYSLEFFFKNSSNSFKELKLILCSVWN